MALREVRQFLGIAQMVARYLGVVEAVGSNPATQTKQDQSERVGLFVLHIRGI